MVWQEERAIYCLCHYFPKAVVLASLAEVGNGNEVVAAFDFPSPRCPVVALFVDDWDSPMAWTTGGDEGDDEKQVFAGALAAVASYAAASPVVGHAVEAAACQVRVGYNVLLALPFVAELVSLHWEEELAFFVACQAKARDGEP